MFKAFRLTIIAAVVIVVIACSATPTRESTGEYLDSTAITTKVKASLIDSLGSKAFKINVKTYKDEVQLSGFVDNNRVKQRAGDIAASVENVQKVRNNLAVK
jgi:osmotically-inducible protein OsmY